MSAEIWEVSTAEKVKIRIGEEVVEVEAPLTAEKLMELVKERGIKKFTVKDTEGNTLTPADFPIETGEITVEEYNEAK